MGEEIVTTDISKFGYRERKMMRELLEASEEQGFPEDFNQEGITIMMNTNSGNVFFTNEEYQVSMMNGDKLESFYSCYCGHEGFKDEMQHEAHHQDCIDYLKEIGVIAKEE